MPAISGTPADGDSFGIAPNKLIDYMMAGCAILHSVEAGNDPVADAGCGLTVAVMAFFMPFIQIVCQLNGGG